MSRADNQERLDRSRNGTGEQHPTGYLHGVQIPAEHVTNWDSDAATKWAVDVLDDLRKRPTT